MNKTMRTLCLVLSLVLVMGMLAACGEETVTVEGVKGKIHDTGVMKVVVPDGWKAFTETGMDGTEYPDKVILYKGVKNQKDTSGAPSITISYFGPDKLFVSARQWYENIVDLEDMELENFTWTGCTGTSFDLPYAILEGTDGTANFQAIILTENTEGTANPDDADVRAILGSVAASDHKETEAEETEEKTAEEETEVQATEGQETEVQATEQQ